jgi:hypothetical protein
MRMVKTSTPVALIGTSANKAGGRVVETFVDAAMALQRGDQAPYTLPSSWALR